MFANVHITGLAGLGAVLPRPSFAGLPGGQEIAIPFARAAVMACLMVTNYQTGHAAQNVKTETIIVEPSKPSDGAGAVYDLSRLPPPVAATRNALIEAARTGDVEALRPIYRGASEPPMLSFGEIEDPITFLKLASGDRNGREILAIMIEVLEAGFVHRNAGTPDEIFIWPYFYGVPLDTLTPAQEVELFEIVTAHDLEDMRLFGAYNFYRLGITPDGSWAFFVAGD